MKSQNQSRPNRSVAWRAVLLLGFSSVLSVGGCPTDLFPGQDLPGEMTVTPSSGTTAGGTAVLIRGQGFTADTTVLFGATGALSQRFLNDTTIQAVAPPGEAGVVDLRLVTASGEMVLPGAFTYTTPPRTPLQVDTISPPRGPTVGGTEVTIQGRSFREGAVVLFGGFVAEQVQVLNDQTIRVIAPAEVAAKVDIVVRNDDGEVARIADGFEYVAIRDADAQIIADIEKRYPGAPRVVSAVSTSNTSVLITFSEPMSSSVAEASNYSIVQENVNPEAGALLVKTAKLGPQQLTVELETFSQNELGYLLSITDVQDLSGNPLAAPEVLVDPTRTTFAGTPPSGAGVDTDQDGLADHVEQRGWIVSIEQSNGEIVQRGVTSDPRVADTDGDGLSDLVEQQRGTDPRTSDSDADRVSDSDELNRWFSAPTKQDTDDDGLIDATEIFFGTAPTLADTDGDQFTDTDEVINRGRNPRVADLPIVGLRVDGLTLALDQRYTYTDQLGQERQSEESYSDSIQRDEATSRTDSSIDSTIGTWQLRGGIKGGYQAGPTGGGFFEAFAEASGGQTYEDTFIGTNQSTSSTSQTFNRAVNQTQSFSSISSITRETLAARVAATVSVASDSDVAFTIDDLEVVVLQADPRDRSRLTPIATLVPTGTNATYNLGPLSRERGPFVFANSDVFPSQIEEVMKDPRGLIFRIANYNITDEFDRNFAFSGQEVVERTATVTIDYSNGQTESHRIATAGAFEPDGRPAGIAMVDALRAVNLTAWAGNDPELGDPDLANETRPLATDAAITNSFGTRTFQVPDERGNLVPVQRITRVRGVQADFRADVVELNKPNDGGFWAVFHTPSTNSENRQREIGTTDFSSIRLYAGERYVLAFVQDKDIDGISSREEFFSGSSDLSPDSDRDGLFDFVEIRGQWNNNGRGAWLVYTDRNPGGYRTYAAPGLVDSDTDGLADAVEYGLCRYRYEMDGSPPSTAFTTGTYPDGQPGMVVWSGDAPNDLPQAFPPSNGLPLDWYTVLDPNTSLPARFPSNRASLDPRKADTDEDGISDADEVNGYFVDLFDDDPTDGMQMRIFVYSDPLRTDTDQDGLPDGMERQFGTNPVEVDSGRVFDDDLDGLPNRVEESGWLVEIDGAMRLVYSNPNDADSDNDNLPDYLEWVLGTSPWYYDGQMRPGVNDAAPGFDSDLDGLGDWEEWDGTVPPERAEQLRFCDLVPNCRDYVASPVAFATNPIDADTDGDAVSDGDEVIAGWLVPVYPNPVGYQVYSDPLDPDSDDDGWTDGQERTAQTDPTLADTDGDGTPDSVEASLVGDFDDDLDGSDDTRDPLRPDQRVTVAFWYLDVAADGIVAGPGAFAFGFGARRPGQAVEDLWATSISALGATGPDAGCSAVLGACSNPTSNVCKTNFQPSSQTYRSIALQAPIRWDLPLQCTTRSFIVNEGDLFSVEGWLWVTEPGCTLTFDFQWFPNKTFIAPVASQSIEFDTLPSQTLGINPCGGNPGGPFAVELGVAAFLTVD